VKVLVVSQAEVAALLPMAACMDAMSEVLQALSRGDAVLPLRQVLRLPDGRGAFAVMPAVLGRDTNDTALAVKAITVLPANHGTAYDSHQGAVLLFEGEHGSLQAILDASALTAIRTAAVSGVATRALAREDAGDLAILGTGVQAGTHLEAMMAARRLRRVRAWSRNPEHVRAFADGARRRYGIAVEPAATARDAVAGADLVCTVTSSREPVVQDGWIAPGAHVNAVGASLATTRELDSGTVARARLFVDRRESAQAEAGDFLIPRAEGLVGDDHIRAELGEVLLGRRPGRLSAGDVTVFKSLGLAVEDLAAARLVHAEARKTGAGTWVELGGERAPNP
jgi:ornithine cyclodeaminase/alanine dehydrogenase-like protein (mu-crystallin family)